MIITLQTQMALIEELNDRFAIGDKIRVQQHDGTMAIWTVSNLATLLGGHTAVIWCKENRSCYSALMVQLERSCRKCGLTDKEIKERRSSWVEEYLCSRCKAIKEVAKK